MGFVYFHRRSPRRALPRMPFHRQKVLHQLVCCIFHNSVGRKKKWNFSFVVLRSWWCSKNGNFSLALDGYTLDILMCIFLEKKSKKFIYFPFVPLRHLNFLMLMFKRWRFFYCEALALKVLNFSCNESRKISFCLSHADSNRFSNNQSPSIEGFNNKLSDVSSPPKMSNRSLASCWHRFEDESSRWNIEWQIYCKLTRKMIT